MQRLTYQWPFYHFEEEPMFRPSRLFVAIAALCSGIGTVELSFPGSFFLTQGEMRSRGGSAELCQCNIVSCISLNPNQNSKGGLGCTQAGPACTACMTKNNNEDVNTPIDTCHNPNCKGANKQQGSQTPDCDGTIGSGTCQLSQGQNPPSKFTCANL